MVGVQRVHGPSSLLLGTSEGSALIVLAVLGIWTLGVFICISSIVNQIISTLRRFSTKTRCVKARFYLADQAKYNDALARVDRHLESRQLVAVPAGYWFARVNAGCGENGMYR